MDGGRCAGVTSVMVAVWTMDGGRCAGVTFVMVAVCVGALTVVEL